MSTPDTALSGASAFVLQTAINAYTDEAYTNAKKINSTGIVSSNPQIKTDTETYIGQMRWYKPLNPTINIASLVTATDGTGTTYSSDYLTYIKTVRTHGATKVNMQEVVTQVDGLAKIGRDFAETRAQDEHNAVLAVLRGVMITEAFHGTATTAAGAGLGGQTFTNDPAEKRYGFYVDLGSALPVIDATSTKMGAARAEGFLNAMGMAWKDYEPAYAYLVINPAVMASLRSANLVDETKVTDGNVVFDTIFSGKFRIIQTRASLGLSSAELTALNTGAGSVDITGTKTSFIVLPGSVAMEALNVPFPTEIYRDARKDFGGGTTDIWYRWGYVAHPAGYSWGGAQEAFPSDANYCEIYDVSVSTTVPATLAGVTLASGDRPVWLRKTSSAISLGILPVFHG